MASKTVESPHSRCVEVDFVFWVMIPFRITGANQFLSREPVKTLKNASQEFLWSKVCLENMRKQYFTVVIS